MSFEHKIEIKNRLPDYLAFKGIDYKRKFKCLNINHQDNSPSMSFDKSNCKVHCFSCGANYDIFDLIGFDYGLTDFSAEYEKACALFGLEITDTRKNISPDMRFIISGLYKSAKRDYFSVKEILSTKCYQYHDIDGAYCFSKYRIDFISDNGKRRKYLIQGVTENGFVRLKLSKGELTNKVSMYGDFRAYNEGETIYIVEGEKCVDSLIERGLKACTAGNSESWKHRGNQFAPYFKNVNVVVLCDNDNAGFLCSADIALALNGIAKSIRILTPCVDTPKADIYDFFANGGTVERLLEMVAKTPLYEAKTTPTKVVYTLLKTVLSENGPESTIIKRWQENEPQIKEILKQCEVVNNG